MDWNAAFSAVIENWVVWLVSALLIWAAWIDGRELKVPNWLTFPMILTGLAYNLLAGGWEGLGFGLLGMCAGLACLLPLYAVGGMGAGDVKLLAGVGAWLGWQTTVWGFVVTVVVGALMAIAMVLMSGKVRHHVAQFFVILNEWIAIRNPEELSKIAAERKPTMHLLPYGIPICIGCIAYFAYNGMFA